MDNPRIKILAIDDQADNLTTLRAVMQDALPACTLVTALNGSRGLELALAEDPDVILLDIVMPVMDGYEFCRRLKADERVRAIPVVFLTALRTDRASRIQALESGADGFLSKPLDEQELVAEVRAMAKIKAASLLLLDEKARLAALVVDRTRTLQESQLALLKTLKDLRAENEARKQAETVLKDNERLLQESQSIASLGNYVLDIGTGLWTSSAVMDQVFGIDRNYEHTVAGWAALIHPDDRAMMMDYFAKEVLVNGHPFDRTYRIIRLDDQSERWVHGLGRLEFDAYGKPRRMLGTIQDITTHKRDAEAQARLAMAVEQAAETIVITDPDGTIVYVNPAFEKITGYSRAEAVGRNPRILKSGEHDAEFYRQMWATLTAGRVWGGHIINRRKDGMLYEEEASLSPVYDDAGKLVNYVAAKRDVTNEAALENQLRQAQKMEAIGHLAGGVAHDFNNMLQSVMGFAELARGRVLPDHPICEDLDEILRSAGRAADLTKQLLTFARKQAVVPRVLDLNDAISTSLKMLRHLIGEDISLVFQPGVALWPVKMDPCQIDQLLANLCVNARDAITGTGTISIETVNQSIDEAHGFSQSSASPGDYVLCRVSDDGCGMTKDIQAHIFEPFFTTKGVGEGTGLGLATVYGIVKQNRGFINVYSDRDKGTTFSIWLPRFGVDAATASTSPAPARQGGTETILLVDDEMGVRIIVARLLKHFGYTVLTAEGPEVALSMAAEHAGPIHLLLTDVAMPGMNGRDLAVKLAKTRPATKALFMSGYAATSITQSDIFSAVVAFLAKPFTPDELAHKIRDVLDSQPADKAGLVASL
jgi:PAS domain S-box-containing protein